MVRKYSVGFDFGTLAARIALVDVETGREVDSLVYAYHNGVIDERLPGTAVRVPNDCAYQDPRDYMAALENLLKGIWVKAKIDPKDIIGIGINFTSCTVISLDSDLMPMCFHSEYAYDLNSWVKVWKHHGAQEEADAINALATKRGEPFIQRYGGKVSSEWLFPKIAETLHKSPRLYEDTFCFMEAGDWITYLLTGNVVKSKVFAGYKGCWSEEEGYPSKEFFKELDPRLENVVEEKIRFLHDMKQPGELAGVLTKELAEKTGLALGTAVSVASIDAHAGVPATGIRSESTMLMFMGTSLCHMLVSQKEVFINGISGVVRNGILPGLYGYEAGQAAVGDIFEWFVGNLVNKEYADEALSRNLNIYDLMEEKAEKVRPGESGCVCLDWWNGNRSILSNSDLSGVIIGLTMNTKPEEIYRAVVEATAFGTRRIVEEFERKGITIKSFYAYGGLSRKSPFTDQVFADVLNREVRVIESKEASSVGSAIFGAVAAGKDQGGFESVFEAMDHMSCPIRAVYKPNSQHKEIYDTLYTMYLQLHDYFGKENVDFMKKLKSFRTTE